MTTETVDRPNSAQPWRETLHRTEDPIRSLLSDGLGRGDLGLNPLGTSVLEVALAWSDRLIELRQLNEGVLTIGEVGADLPASADDLPLPIFPLFEMKAGVATARLDPAWRCTERRAAGSAPALNDEGLRLVELRAGDQLVLDIGPLCIIARVGAPGARVAARRPAPDQTLMTTGLVATMLAMCFAIVALNTPPRLDGELYEIPDRIARVAMMQPVPDKPLTQKLEKQEEAGERAKREEGRAGREDARMDRARGEQINRDRQVANEAGVLGALSDDPSLNSVMGDGGLDGMLANGLGNLSGPKGVQIGSGYGDRGPGPGGGGRAHTGVGPDLNTKGRNTDYGKPQEGPVKTDGKIRTEGGTQVGTALTKNEIDQVIKNNLNRFRYCYQRQLMREPTLGGKVVLGFSIAKDGSVSGATVKSSTVGSDAVGQCMTQVMFKLQFPEPRGGGVVLVSYPFLFSPE